MLKLKENDLIRSATYASVAVGIMIMLIKIYGWLATSSQSLLASLIDSLLDVSSSFINLIAIRISLLPPDDNHRFGHEKFQDLAIFSQSMFFISSGIFTFISSIKVLFEGNKLTNIHIGVNLMYLCIGLTLLLIIYQNYVHKKTNSKIIAADKLHYVSDFLTNIVVILSLYISSTFWIIDFLTGIGISLYIIYFSYKMLREAIKNLCDEEFSLSDKQRILKIVGSFTKVHGIHELKTRCAANKLFIQFHIEMDGNMSLYEAHIIGDEIMDALNLEFPNAEIIIHQDPEGIEKHVNYRESISSS